MNEIPLRVALAPHEQTVFKTIVATGQGNGRLYDPGLVLETVRKSGLDMTKSELSTWIHRLYLKRYLPPAGISDEARDEASDQLQAFLRQLEEAHQAGAFTWHNLGVSPSCLRALRKGGSAIQKTITTIGRNAHLPDELTAKASQAAPLLRRYEISRKRRRPVLFYDKRWCEVCQKLVEVYKGSQSNHHVICEDCSSQRNLPRMKEGRVFTNSGKWLYAIIVDWWGSVNKFSTATGIVQLTLQQCFFKQDHCLRRPTLSKLTSVLRQIVLERGEDPAPYERRLRDAFGPKPPESRTSSRTCPMCGRVVSRENKRYCAGRCNNLARIFSSGFKNDVEMRLFAAMATATGFFTNSRVASLLSLPTAEVESWFVNGGLQTLTGRIRTELGDGAALKSATARVLKWGTATLDQYLHHRKYRLNRKRPGPLRFPPARHIQHLASSLGMTEEDVMKVLKIKKTFEQYMKGRQQDASRASLRHSQGRARHGRLPSQCRMVRAIVDLFSRGSSNGDVIRHLEEVFGIVLESRDIANYLRRHVQGQRCPTCRPLVAFHFHLHAGKNEADLARFLDVSRPTIVKGLEYARKRVRSFAYFLSTSQMVARAHDEGFKNVTADTIRALIKTGKVSAARAHGDRGKWKFRPDAVSQLLLNLGAGQEPIEHSLYT